MFRIVRLIGLDHTVVDHDPAAAVTGHRNKGEEDTGHPDAFIDRADTSPCFYRLSPLHIGVVALGRQQ